MNPRATGPMDQGQINQFLQNLKRQMSQIEGEVSTMRSDATSSLFQNFAALTNQVFQERERSNAELATTKAILEEIYQGHPDIKISIEAKAKEEAEAANKKKVKVTKAKK